MTIGEKIKRARVARSMTQSEVAGDRITRNMLSAIESGKAAPSFETAEYIAKTLELPLGYLLDNSEDSLAFYVKKDLMPKIRDAYSSGKYNECVSLILSVEFIDDELAYLLSYCCFELGKEATKCGALKTALKYMALLKKYAKETIYDTSKIQAVASLYEAIANNVNAPLLEFDVPVFVDALRMSTDYELYKYLVNDLSYDYTNPLFKSHAEAKAFIKERRYTRAIEMLQETEAQKSKHERNVYVTFCIYADLEYCYKQILDFENAYKYASKRMSMLEGFDS